MPTRYTDNQYGPGHSYPYPPYPTVPPKRRGCFAPMMLIGGLVMLLVFWPVGVAMLLIALVWAVVMR